MGTRGRAMRALAAAHKLDKAVRTRPASLNHPKMKAQRNCLIQNRGKPDQIKNCFKKGGAS